MMRYGIGIFAISIMLMVAITAGCASQQSSRTASPSMDSNLQDSKTDSKTDTGSTAENPASDAKEFEMEARQWEFTPSEITVNKGDKVRLIITSTDVSHGIALPDFGVSTRLEPGKTETVEFTADKTGEFMFFCNVFCGNGHGNMVGKLIVR